MPIQLPALNRRFVIRLEHRAVFPSARISSNARQSEFVCACRFFIPGRARYPVRKPVKALNCNISVPAGQVVPPRSLSLSPLRARRTLCRRDPHHAELRWLSIYAVGGDDEPLRRGRVAGSSTLTLRLIKARLPSPSPSSRPPARPPLSHFVSCCNDELWTAPEASFSIAMRTRAYGQFSVKLRSSRGLTMNARPRAHRPARTHAIIERPAASVVYWNYASDLHFHLAWFGSPGGQC